MRRFSTPDRAGPYAFQGSRRLRLPPTLAGHYAVTVNGNRRLTFRFEGQDAVLVDYLQQEASQAFADAIVDVTRL